MSIRPFGRVRVGIARLRQLIGLAGIVGLALMVVSAILMSMAWSTHKAYVVRNVARAVESRGNPPDDPSVAAENNPQVSIKLPTVSDIALLLTQIRQAATSSELTWRAADYRIIAATAALPASLEVRCSIKGPYPKLRRMIVELKDEVPGFSIREFSASRPDAAATDIEAKLTLAIFLQDDPLAFDVSTRRTTEGRP